MALTADREGAVVSPPAQQTRTDPGPDRTGTVALWALLGALGLAIAGQAWIRWILSSSQFSPAPILGPDHYASWRLVTLRCVEGISVVVLVWLIWLTVVRPLRREGRLQIDGMITIGCVLGCITDGVLNIYKYIFAWNAHSINLGSWSGFLLLGSPHANHRYAEALLWGVPMYAYFCIGIALAGCWIVSRLRASRPEISNMSALAAVYAFAFVFDFVVENLIIRSTQAYGFARTPSPLTLWAGSQYQFPIYECVFVAALGTIFTALRLSALDAPDGVSFVERGFERFRPSLQMPLRLLAVIGFCVMTLLVVYHLGTNWLGTNGSSVAHLASYMKP